MEFVLMHEKRMEKSKNKDIAILQDIYRMKILTAEQIRKVHFPNVKQYHYHKLRDLYAKGLIDKKAYVENRRKKATIYWLTNKGITYLENEGALIGVKRQARDNKPAPHFYHVYVEGNDLYAELEPNGYRYIDSREWKRAYNLYTNTQVKGGLVFPNGHMYAVYHLFEKKTSEDRINKILRELKNHTQSGRAIIFVKDTNLFAELERTLINNIQDFPLDELCLFLKGFGIDLLKHFNNQSEEQFILPHLRKYIIKQGINPTSDRVLPITSFKDERGERFADYVYQFRDDSGDLQELYIVNHLKSNHKAISHVRTHYSDIDFYHDQRPVLFITWNPHVTMLEQEFIATEYVNVLGINPITIKPKQHSAQS